MPGTKYPAETRKKAIDMYAYYTVKEISEQLEVSIPTIQRWFKNENVRKHRSMTDPDFIQEVARVYERTGSARVTAQRLGMCGKENIYRILRKNGYNVNSKTGSKPRDIYPVCYKQQVISYLINSKNLAKTATKFDLPVYLILKWYKKYMEQKDD